MLGDLFSFISKPNSSDEDPNIRFTALVTSALFDKTPDFSLTSIVEYIKDYSENASEYLDPLSLFSLLMPSVEPASDALLDLIKDHCSSKEVIIASEEILERIHRVVVLDEEQDESEDDGENEEGKEKRDASLSVQILRLVRMFSAISNIPFRRKTASDTIQSFIPEIESTIRILASRGRFSKSIGREVIWHCAVLVDRIIDWVEKKEVVEKEEIKDCEDILRPFLSSVVDSLSHCIQASVAKRAFKQCFPRIGLRVTLDQGWEKGDQVVQKAISTYTRVGGLLSSSSKSAFVFFAHTQFSDPYLRITTYFPIILASIKSNTLLDESLSVLLLSFYSPAYTGINPESHTIPLLTLLPSLASAHPDPFIRHCTFRVLGLVLNVAPVPLQIQVLTDLVGDTGENGKSQIGSQMRVAAIGLVKDAVLRALTEAESKTESPAGFGGLNMLASPRFLQTFAPILFVQEPPDLFDNTEKKVPTVKELEEDKMNTELLRLAEVLSLYYVLEVRDVKNRTGIRDRDNRAKIERTLLAPMRRAVPRWIEAVEAELEERELKQEEIGPESNIPSSRAKSHGSVHAHLHSHALVPLISLQMGLERINDMRNMETR